MSTKGQTINQAYQQLRISGLTVNPTPNDLALGLVMLESMMAEYLGQYNLNINYQFQTVPTFNAETGVNIRFQSMMDFNLATRLAPAFDKEVPPKLTSMASVALSNAIGVVAVDNARMIQAPRRMPLGSGNTYRGVFWNRYNVPISEAPVSGYSNYILQGETLDYQESFVAWLAGNTISSYTIECTQMLAIVTSSQSAGVVSYTITAPVTPPATFPPLQLVQITVTDSGGRTEIRIISFQVTTPPPVPS